MPEYVIPWGSYYNLAGFAYDILAQIFGLPDPLDLFLSSLSGRPTMQATVDLSHSFKQFPTPITYLLSVGAGQLLSQGIPISSPKAGPIFGKFFAAAVYIHEALRFNQLSPSNQTLAAATLSTAQGEAANPGSRGTGTLQALVSDWTGYATTYPNFDALKAIYQWTATDDASLIAESMATKILTTLDPSWVASHPTPQPAPPPPPGPPYPDPALDELGDIGASIVYYLANISTAIAGMDPKGFDPCCQEQITILQQAVTVLQGIQTVISSLNLGGGVDLGPVTAEIKCVCDQLSGIAGEMPKGTAAVVDAINKLTTAITNNNPTDTGGIVDELKKIVDQGDVDNSIFQALKQLGLMTGADLQTLQGIKWSDALSYITHSAAYRLIQKLGAELGLDVETGAADVRSALGVGGNWALRFIAGVMDHDVTGTEPWINKPLHGLEGLLTPKGPVVTGDVKVDADRVIAWVVELFIWSMSITIIAATLREGAGEQIGKVLEKLFGILGLEELREVQIGPLIRFGIARIAEMRAKVLFRQEIPGATVGYDLVARGIIPRAGANGLAAFNGLPQEYEAPFAEAAYSGMNARMLLRMVDTGLLTDADIRDELIFSGMRPASQARLLRVAPYLATAPQRSQLQAELEREYQAGLLSDDELVQHLENSEQNTNKIQLILNRVHIVRIVDSVKALETEYATMYQAGIINADTYRLHLETMGLQEWKISDLVAVQEARASARLAREDARAAAALARATASAERKTAIANYMAGNINALELMGALTLTGLTLAQAGAMTNLAVVKRGGNLRWVFGQQLLPPQATLLTDRVHVLEKQLEDNLITRTQFVDALQQLQIGSRWINYLLAAAEAAAKTKASGTYVPVETK